METLAGRVTHYFGRIGVAIVELVDEIRLGDSILLLGHTTDFTQRVNSLEVGHQKISCAGTGKLVALKVEEPVRAGDEVFKLSNQNTSVENLELWNLMCAAWEVIQVQYHPVIERAASEAGLDGREIGLLLAAISSDPEPITIDRLHMRNPFTAGAAYLARLDKIANQGYLMQAAPGEYRLTTQGRSWITKLVEDSRKAMVQADPLPETDSQRLAGLLDPLAQACLNFPPPPGTWSIRLAFKLMPPECPPLPYIEQTISCLHAYRDDAHQAAWQPGGLSAPAMEALTLIWQEVTFSLDRIVQKLAHRGHSPQVYANALQELRDRAVLSGSDTALLLTEVGRTFREKIEQDTDCMFFAPWTCLETPQREDLLGLLNRLIEGLLNQTSPEFPHIPQHS